MKYKNLSRRLDIRVDEQIWRGVQRLAKKERVSDSQIVRRALRKYLEERAA